MNYPRAKKECYSKINLGLTIQPDFDTKQAIMNGNMF